MLRSMKGAGVGADGRRERRDYFAGWMSVCGIK